MTQERVQNLWKTGQRADNMGRSNPLTELMGFKRMAVQKYITIAERLKARMIWMTNPIGKARVVMNERVMITTEQ